MRFLAIAVLAASGISSSCSTVPEPAQDRVAGIPRGGGLEVAAPEQQARVREAEARLQAGDVDAAIRIARELVASEPRDTTARLLLGSALAARSAATTDAPAAIDLRDEAETELLAAVELAPRDPRAHTALASLYEMDGHLEAALAAHREALQHSAFHRPALTAAARLATELGEERRAARHLEALRALPDFPAAALEWEIRCYLTLAESPDAENRATWLQRARRAFVELGERDAGDPRAPAGEAYCRVLAATRAGTIQDDEKTTIRSLYQRAARLAPEDPLPRFNLARFLESELVGDERAAIEEYRATLRRDPGHVPSHLNLARLLWRAGDRDGARVLYRRALPLIDDDLERREVERVLK